MNATNDDEPRFYSQATAAAMHAELERQRETIQRLQTEIGMLNREAEHQAESIQQMRADVEHWRAQYARAATSDSENA